MDGFFQARQFGFVERGAPFIQFDRQPLLVGDDQIASDLVADGDHHQLESTAIQIFLEQRSGFPPGRYDGQRFASKRMDHARGIDATSACRLSAGGDVRAIFKYQAVNGDGPIDGWIYGNSDDQTLILAECRCYPENCSGILESKPTLRSRPCAFSGALRTWASA